MASRSVGKRLRQRRMSQRRRQRPIGVDFATRILQCPVRLSRLGEFGTPEFVADKLIQAEKRKESTKEAEVVGVAERSGQEGLQVYEFEYKVDSTRGGMKRIFSAAFVASKKLYLLNIAHSDKPESPLDTQTRVMLEEVLHSFDSAPLT